MTRLVLNPSRTVHLAIDMQRVFAEDTEWRIAGFDSIVPKVSTLARAMPDRTLFTRFVTPRIPEEAVGRWRHYYDRWRQFTGAVAAPGLIDIVDALSSDAARGQVIDKPGYSAFEVAACETQLAALLADTVLITGVETDVCVLATMFSAVDKGYRVIAVADALGSSSREGHRATLEHILPRMPDQIEVADTAAVLLALKQGSIAVG